MAVIYSHNASQLDEDLCLDSRFYDPKKTAIAEVLLGANHKRISSEFKEVTDLTSSSINAGIFPALNYDLPHSIGNILEAGVTVNSLDGLGSTKKIFLSSDIIISRLRYYLKEIALVPEREMTQLGSTEYVVIRTKGVLDTAMLLPFLLSTNVQYLFSCSQRGSNHPRLANKDILNLPLPSFLIALNDKIKEMVLSAIKEFEKVEKLYIDAETELLERLEWNVFDKRHILNYSATSEEVLRNTRFDSEFFQPQFFNLVHHLDARGSQEIAKFCPVPKRGVSPEYVDGGEAFIVNSQNLEKNGMIDLAGLDRTSLLFYNNESNSNAILKERDVLTYATGAYIGRTNCWFNNLKALAGIDCLILRPDEKACNPVYLSLFLNSEPGLMQSDQRATGSAQRHLYPSDLLRFKVFIPKNKEGNIDLEWQNKLATKVVLAYEAKESANSKIKAAVDLVEVESKKVGLT